jgi:hypothetical protein
VTPLIRHASAALLALLAAWPYATRADAEPLRFRIVEGRVLNAFHQDGDVAAHLLLTSGGQPRILAAFPAGNSGVGVWFRESAEPVRWTVDTVRSERRPDAQGRQLRGIRAEASVDGGRLMIRDAVLGSVRVLRDFQLGTAYPPETRAEAKLDGDTVRWSRDRIDGAPGYEIALEVTHGDIRRDGGAIVLVPVDGEPIRLRITALTGEPPLTPFPASQLFAPGASDDLHSRQALRFLSYHEKFLAGSWRFDTYFGRDTLMSLRLLMPALRPDAMEAGLASVLKRLDPNGDVAHEEDIGEFAVLRHRKEGIPPGAAADAPIYDYKMIDDDFMLAPVAAAWLLDHPEGRKRAQAFLARRLGSGETNGAALVRNFGFVLRQARAFAQDPVARNLVALKPGLNVGQWRDSEDGLAGGRYAYDVNAVFVPAALSAIARFVDAGLLDDRLAPEQRAAFAEAAAYARTWTQRAPPLFEVELPAADARERIRRYAAQSGVDAKAALDSLGEGPLRFPALALDGGGNPIPVLHSDTGFALLFTDPEPPALDGMVHPTLRSFPAGLLTGAGMLVANPALASADVQRVFGPNAYHGTVVWSWQQALMAAGLQRQLERRDLRAATRTRLQAAQAALWEAIDATRATRTSELWSWSYADGRYRAAPFGQNRGDADESNAAQLWSTVYLAVSRPGAEALPAERAIQSVKAPPSHTDD